MTTLKITISDVQQDMDNSAHVILQLKCGQYSSEQSLNFHALILLWKVGIEHSNILGYAHPTVYKLINSMRLEQPHTENLKAKIDAGQNVVRKIQKYVYE